MPKKSKKSDSVKTRLHTNILKSVPGLKVLGEHAPQVTPEDRTSYEGVLEKYKTLVAEITMERMVDSLVQGEDSGVQMLRIMSPYLFKREAQVIETKSLDGSIDEQVEQELLDFLEDDNDED